MNPNKRVSNTMKSVSAFVEFKIIFAIFKLSGGILSEIYLVYSSL